MLNCLVASLPPTEISGFLPPGCSPMNCEQKTPRHESLRGNVCVCAGGGGGHRAGRRAWHRAWHTVRRVAHGVHATTRQRRHYRHHAHMRMQVPPPPPCLALALALGFSLSLFTPCVLHVVHAACLRPHGVRFATWFGHGCVWNTGPDDSALAPALVRDRGRGSWPSPLTSVMSYTPPSTTIQRSSLVLCFATFVWALCCRCSRCQARGHVSAWTSAGESMRVVKRQAGEVWYVQGGERE